MLVTSEAKRFRSTTSSRGRKAQPDKQHNPCPTENHQRGITDLGLEPETHTISAVGCAAITYARPAVMPLRLAAIGLSSQPFLTANLSTKQFTINVQTRPQAQRQRQPQGSRSTQSTRGKPATQASPTQGKRSLLRHGVGRTRSPKRCSVLQRSPYHWQA